MKFEFKKVIKDDALLEEIYRLRYRVYCEEWGFEKPEDYPGGLEFDAFDEHSVHCAAMSKDGNEQLIGTVRLVLSSEKGFPIERHCKIDVDLSHLDRDKIGEISRLAICKECRRRAEDRLLYSSSFESKANVQRVESDGRRRQEIVCGLYKCIYIESKRISLTHWYAVMAKGLFLLLKRLGIVFRPIGPEIEYHGLRTPYIASIEELEEEVERLNPELYREFTKGLLQ